MDGVAVAARASVDADVGTFRGGKAGEDFVVEVDKGFEEGSASPGVAWVVFGSEATYSPINWLEKTPGAYTPSVKSIDTLFAPASKQPRISFSHCQGQ